MSDDEKMKAAEDAIIEFKKANNELEEEKKTRNKKQTIKTLEEKKEKAAKQLVKALVELDKNGTNDLKTKQSIRSSKYGLVKFNKNDIQNLINSAKKIIDEKEEKEKNITLGEALDRAEKPIGRHNSNKGIYNKDSIIEFLNKIASKCEGAKKFDKNSKYEDVINFFNNNENKEALNKLKLKKTFGSTTKTTNLGDDTLEFLETIYRVSKDGINAVKDGTNAIKDGTNVDKKKNNDYVIIQNFLGSIQDKEFNDQLNKKKTYEPTEPEPEPTQPTKGEDMEKNNNYVTHPEYDEYTTKTNERLENLENNQVLLKENEEKVKYLLNNAENFLTKDDIEELKSALKYIGDIATINVTIRGLEGKIEELENAKISPEQISNQIKAIIEKEILPAINQKIENNENEINALKGRVDQHDEEINKLKNQVTALQNTLGKGNNITSDDIKKLIENGDLDDSLKAKLTVILNEGDINITEGSKFYEQIQGIISTELGNKLSDLEGRLNDKIQQNTNNITNLTNKIGEIDDKIKNCATKDDVNNQIEGLKNNFATKEDFDNFKKEVEEKLGGIGKDGVTLTNTERETIINTIKEGLGDQIGTLQDDVGKLKDNQEKITSDLDALKTKVKQHDTDIKTLQDQVIALQNTLKNPTPDDIKKLIENGDLDDSLKAKLTVILNEGDINIGGDSKFYKQIQGIISTELGNKLKELEDKLGGKIKQNTDEIKNIKDQQENFNNRITGCEGNITELNLALEDEIENRQNAMLYLTERIESGEKGLQDQLTTMQNQIQALQKAQNSLNSGQETKVTEITNNLLTEYNETVQAQMEVVTRELEIINEQQDQIQNQITQLDNRLNEQDKKIDTKADKTTVEELVKRMDRYEERLGKYEKENERLINENEELKKRIEALEKKEQDKVQARDTDPPTEDNPNNPENDPSKSKVQSFGTKTPEPGGTKPKGGLQNNKDNGGNLTSFGTNNGGGSSGSGGIPTELSDEDKVKHLSNLYYLIGTANQYNKSEVKTGLAVANMLNARSTGEKNTDGVVPTLNKLSENLANKIIGTINSGKEVNINEIINLNGLVDDKKLQDIVNKYQNGITAAKGDPEKIKIFKETLKNELYGCLDLEFINRADNVYKANNQGKDNEFLENFYKNVDNASSYLQQTTIKNNVSIPNTSKVQFVNEDKTINEESLNFIQENINGQINEEGVKKDYETKEFNGDKQQFEATKEAVIHTERTKNQFSGVERNDKGEITKVEGIKSNLTNDKATIGLKYPNDFSKEYMDTIEKSGNDVKAVFSQKSKKVSDLPENQKNDAIAAYNLKEGDSVEVLNFNGVEAAIPSSMLDFVELNNGIGRDRGILPAMLEQMKKAAVLNGGNMDKIRDLITVEIDGQRMTLTEAVNKGKGKEAASILCNSMGAVGNDGKTPLGHFKEEDRKLINDLCGKTIAMSVNTDKSRGRDGQGIPSKF